MRDDPLADLPLGPTGRLNRTANPFVARDGAVPPAFGGRDEVLGVARLDLEQLRADRPAARRALEGVRGVGKTALMAYVRRVAESASIHTAHIEADPGIDPTEIARLELLDLLTRIAPTRRLAQSLRGLRSVKVGPGGLELAWDGRQDDTLVEALVLDAARAARDRGTAVFLTLDEAHEAEPSLLKPLLRALHRADQDGLPAGAWVAGLPDTLKHLIEQGQTYAERVHVFRIGMLDDNGVARALRRPFETHDVAVGEEVIPVVAAESGGYPFFVQCWGEALWNVVGDAERLSAVDVDAARPLVTVRSNDLMRSRWSRLSPAARRYAAALAALGEGTQRTREVAERLGSTTKRSSVAREQLLASGAALASRRGVIEFTIPGFAAWVERTAGG